MLYDRRFGDGCRFDSITSNGWVRLFCYVGFGWTGGWDGFIKSNQLQSNFGMGGDGARRCGCLSSFTLILWIGRGRGKGECDSLLYLS